MRCRAPGNAPTHRIAGDTLALTPPLIISEDQIGEIVEKVGKVIKAVA